MPINNITQTISTIPKSGRRGIDVQTIFVTKQEGFQDHLVGTTVTELNTLKDQLNTRIGEINSTTTTMNGYADTASAGASTATTKAGEASTSASQALTSRNQAETFAQQAQASASSVDASNIVHRTGAETIAGVKTFSSNIVGNITGNAGTATNLATARTINGVAFDGSANITVRDSTAVNLTGNQIVSGVKTFNSSPWVPNLAVTDYSNNAATTAFVAEKILAFFAAPNVSLASNGYQKLPSGLIIQWGTSTNTSYQTYQTFPLVFPNALYSLTASAISSNLAVAANNYIITTENLTTSSFYWNGVDTNGSIQSTAGGLQIKYIAIGG